MKSTEIINEYIVEVFIIGKSGLRYGFPISMLAESRDNAIAKTMALMESEGIRIDGFDGCDLVG